MKVVLVSAVALIDVDGRVWLGQRPKGKSMAGLWEFPGGKVELNERHYDSLVRELKEELNITVTSASPLMQISHDYSDKSVTLDIWKVTKFDGYAEGVEGQETRWVPLSELRDYNFPTANQAILERLISDQSPLA